MIECAEKYVRRHMRKVDGWLHRTSAEMLVHIGQIQILQGITGNLVEIGVHHGKLLILMHHLARENDTVTAIDVFADQHLNLDGSGRGDEKFLMRNLSRFGNPSVPVRVIRSSSDAITPAQLKEYTGAVRLFSIDGGHTADLTFNDLRLADCVLCDGGVVVLDDVFNEAWPDVSSGFYRYLSRYDTSLSPFAISPNKLFLARPPFNHLYREALLLLPLQSFYKKTSFMGCQVVLYLRPRRPVIEWIRHKARQYGCERQLLALSGIIRMLIGERSLE